MSTIDTFHKGVDAFGGPQASTLTYRAFAGIESLLNRLAIAAEKQRSRRALRNLNDHQLRDIGITRYEAEAEANRSVWY